MKSLSVRRRHPLAALAVLFTALLVTGGLYTALTSSNQAEASPGASLAEEQGRELFVQTCSSCHGLDAQGTTDGPSLIGVGGAAVDFQVATGRMPLAQPGAQAQRKPPVYSQPEIDQLAAYVDSLAPGPSAPTREEYAYKDADLVEGGELFRSNCAQCHNFAGEGGALTHGKFAPSLKDVEPKHMYEAMLTGPQSMPVFGDGTLHPEEKQDIIKFVSSLEKEPNPGGAGLGRIGPVSEGLVIWVVGLGVLIAAAVWLTARAK
ncbi:MAG: cytochrome bc1 complex diheme cytochrome c subunit [Actinomycetes bacterium]